jgi:hypothetical protein
VTAIWIRANQAEALVAEAPPGRVALVGLEQARKRYHKGVFGLQHPQGRRTRRPLQLLPEMRETIEKWETHLAYILTAQTSDSTRAAWWISNGSQD